MFEIDPKFDRKEQQEKEYNIDISIYTLLSVWKFLLQLRSPPPSIGPDLTFVCSTPNSMSIWAVFGALCRQDKITSYFIHTVREIIAGAENRVGAGTTKLEGRQSHSIAGADNRAGASTTAGTDNRAGAGTTVEGRQSRGLGSSVGIWTCSHSQLWLT